MSRNDLHYDYYLGNDNILQAFATNTLANNESLAISQAISHKPEPHRQPNDLGHDFYTKIKAKFEKEKGCKADKSAALFRYWQEKNKQNIKNNKKDDNFILFCENDKIDVEFTLEEHFNQAQNIGSFIQKSLTASEKQSPQKKTKISENVQKRLYPKVLASAHPRIEPKPIIVQFTENLMDDFKEQKPNLTAYKSPEILFSHWLQLSETEKDQKSLNVSEMDATNYLQRYFMGIVENINAEYKKCKGVDGWVVPELKLCESCEKEGKSKCEECVEKEERVKKAHGKLFNFWKTTNPKQRKRMAADFDKDNEKNLENAISIYIEKIKDKKKPGGIHGAAKSENMHSPSQMPVDTNPSAMSATQYKTEKRQKSKENQAEEKKSREKLWMPKDRLKKGKILLGLKELFPRDKLLRKMLLIEFRDTKITKAPAEYDIYDPEKEELIRYGKQIKFDKDKTKDLTTMYHDLLKRYQLDKQDKIKGDEEKKKEFDKQESAFKVFLEEKAKEYKKLRMRRYEEKIPTIKEYLKDIYKHCFQQYPLVIKKLYPLPPKPSQNENENKQSAIKNKNNDLKESEIKDQNENTMKESKISKKTDLEEIKDEDCKDFPASFKRQFFLLYKQINNLLVNPKKATERVAVWLPPSNLNNEKHYNDYARTFSRDTKAKIQNDNWEKVGVWERDEFLDERKLIMMKLSDAAECTFYPKVGNKVPFNQKQLALNLHPLFAADYYKHKELNPEKYVKMMGKNFSIRHPLLFKYGTFKRALRYLKEGKFIKSFSELYKAFNIENIRKYFIEESGKDYQPM